MKSENWAKTKEFLEPCMADKPTACAVLLMVSEDGLQIVSLNMDREEANVLISMTAASLALDTNPSRVLQ